MAQRCFCIVFPPLWPEALCEKGTRVSLSPNGVVGRSRPGRGLAQQSCLCPPELQLARGAHGFSKAMLDPCCWACRTWISEEHLVVASAWLYEDLPGISMASWEPELAQDLADTPGSQPGAPPPCLPALPETQRLAQPGCSLGQWA